MNEQLVQDLLQEAEEIAVQAEHLVPCWQELLEQAHLVGEQIQEQVQTAVAKGDSVPV